jgi:hypothetical protein
MHKIPADLPVLRTDRFLPYFQKQIRATQCPSSVVPLHNIFTSCIQSLSIAHTFLCLPAKLTCCYEICRPSHRRWRAGNRHYMRSIAAKNQKTTQRTKL